MDVLVRRCGAKFVLVTADWHVKSGTVDGDIASSLPLGQGKKALDVCDEMARESSHQADKNWLKISWTFLDQQSPDLTNSTETGKMKIKTVIIR